MKNKSWLLTASLLVLCLITALWALTSRRFPKLHSLFTLQAAEAATYEVKKVPFAVQVPAFGELEAAASTPISVPRVQTGGLKIFWLVRDGSIVKKGDPLVEFDASELIQQMQETENNLEAALRQLEASVLRGNADTGETAADHAVAAMELDKAHTQAPRDEQIFSRNQIIEGELNVGLSSTKVKEYSGKIETKKSIGAASQRILVIEKKKHETRKGQLAQSLTSLKILAPHDGMILLQKDAAGNGINIGETRWPGFVLMTLPDTSAMKARVQVQEADAGNLKVGQHAKVVVDSHPETSFDATVEKIDTIARTLDKDSPVKYFEVVLKIAAAGGEILKPGKLIRAEITTAEYADALAVPRVAVVEEALKHFVWVQRSSGHEKRAVEIGSGDTARVVLKFGVREGEAVLLNPPKQAK